MMKAPGTALFALGLVLCSTTAAFAQQEKDVPATETQKKLLHGLTSVKYCIPFDKSNSIADTVKKSFSESKMPITEYSKDAESQSLKSTEGRVVVIADYRDKDKSWVGLTVNQQVRLNRAAEPTWNGKTYESGKLVVRSKEKEAAKALCDEFVAALNKK